MASARPVVAPHAVVFSTVTATLTIARAVSRGAPCHPTLPPRRSLPHEAPDDAPSAAVQFLGLGTALEGERSTRSRRSRRREDERRQVDDVVDRLVPLDMARPVHLEARRPGRSDPPRPRLLPVAASICAAASAGTGPARGRSGRRPPRPARAGTRSGRTTVRTRRPRCRPGHEHAPLEAHLVLRRRRPIRVQHVPLVEDGIGHRPRRGEAVPASRARSHGPPPRLP